MSEGLGWRDSPHAHRSPLPGNSGADVGADRCTCCIPTEGRGGGCWLILWERAATDDEEFNSEEYPR